MSAKDSQSLDEPFLKKKAVVIKFGHQAVVTLRVILAVFVGEKALLSFKRDHNQTFEWDGKGLN